MELLDQGWRRSFQQDQILHYPVYGGSELSSSGSFDVFQWGATCSYEYFRKTEFPKAMTFANPQEKPIAKPAKAWGGSPIYGHWRMGERGVVKTMWWFMGIQILRESQFSFFKSQNTEPWFNPSLILNRYSKDRSILSSLFPVSRITLQGDDQVPSGKHSLQENP